MWASGWYYDAQMNVARLDANTLNHAIRPNASPIEGKLGGKVQVLGPVNDPAAVTGNASLRLTESDLVHADMLSQVFRGLGLMKEVRENRGYGNMRMRLEGGALVIDEFRCYNRGAYIFGDGRVDNIAAGGHSPIHMEIVGSTRPFKRANFPGANLLDQFLMNLEATVSSVRVAGTVSQPKVELRTLEDAHRALVGIFGKAERAEASPVD